MPALQVKDFPDELYDALKSYAAQEHRSMSQQTVVAVEEMLSQAQGGARSAEGVATIVHFDSPADRERRIERRRAALQVARGVRWEGGRPTAEELVRTIHQGRANRDGQLVAGLEVAPA